jgi:preprotein translocase subunit SecG
MALTDSFGPGSQDLVDQPLFEEIMNKLLAAIMVAMFATVSVAPAIAAEKKETAKVDCKDPKNKDHKDCKAKK